MIHDMQSTLRDVFIFRVEFGNEKFTNYELRFTTPPHT